MAVIPTNLGAPTYPNNPGARRIANVSANGANSALIDVARIRSKPYQNTIAGLKNVANAYDEVQLKDDQKEAKDLWVGLSQAKRQVLEKYYQLNGDEAVKAKPQVEAELEKLRQEWMGKASNQQVGAIFEPTSQNLIQPDLDNIGMYAVKQKEVAAKATSLAISGEALENFAANPTNDTVRNTSEAVIIGEANAQLDRDGITDPKARQSVIDAAVSNMYRAGIATALGRDPDYGKELYNKYKNKILGTDQTAIDQDIRQAENQKKAEEAHRIALEERNIRKFKEAEDERLFDALVNGKLTPKDIADSGADPADKRVYLNALESQDSGASKLRVDNDLYIDLFKRIGLPESDPRRIKSRSEFTQYLGNGLDDTKLGNLDTEFNKVNKEGDTVGKELKDQALKAAEEQLSGSNSLLGLKDPKGQEQVGKFLSWMTKYVEDQKKAGMTDRDIFDPDNPKSVYKGIPQFTRTPQQMFEDLRLANPGNPGTAIQAAQETAKTITNQKEYDALQPGEKYIWNGKEGTKPSGSRGGLPAVSAPTGD